MRQHGHARLRLLLQRITEGTRLSLAGGGSLQPVELSRGALGRDDARGESAQLRAEASLESPPLAIGARLAAERSELNPVRAAARHRGVALARGALRCREPARELRRELYGRRGDELRRGCLIPASAQSRSSSSCARRSRARAASSLSGCCSTNRP